MSASKPVNFREPYCVHAPYGQHGASSCSTCKDGAAFREWRDGWDAWLAENPGSQEAKWVKATSRCVTAQNSNPDHLKGIYYYPCSQCVREEAIGGRRPSGG